MRRDGGDNFGGGALHEFETLKQHGGVAIPQRDVIRTRRSGLKGEPRRLWHQIICLLVAGCYFSKSLRLLSRMGPGTRVVQGGNRSAIAP